MYTHVGMYVYNLINVYFQIYSWLCEILKYVKHTYNYMGVRNTYIYIYAHTFILLLFQSLMLSTFLKDINCTAGHFCLLPISTLSELKEHCVHASYDELFAFNFYE